MAREGVSAGRRAHSTLVGGTGGSLGLEIAAYPGDTAHSMAVASDGECGKNCKFVIQLGNDISANHAIKSEFPVGVAGCLPFPSAWRAACHAEAEVLTCRSFSRPGADRRRLSSLSEDPSRPAARSGSAPSQRTWTVAAAARTVIDLARGLVTCHGTVSDPPPPPTPPHLCAAG